MAKRSIPDIVIGRLPVYLRALNFLIAEGRQITSSQELGDRLGISSAQIRKDLSHFGEFGKQGTGYDIVFLYEQLSAILKVNRMWDVALVGAGNLGKAIADYPGFAGKGFRISAIFDTDPTKIGKIVGVHDATVLDVQALGPTIQERGIVIGIIATPAVDAQAVARTMIDAGVKSILNYAPITLTVPTGVRVQYIDPVVGLQRMTYYL
ncbi:MAG: redox-sensing transcriptional repressor Rex [Chloroflexi bacterium]|nr:redox-sensing transcriptional repressor Rex [Chloroflexota bacterium]